MQFFKGRSDACASRWHDPARGRSRPRQRRSGRNHVGGQRHRRHDLASGRDWRHELNLQRHGRGKLGAWHRRNQHATDHGRRNIDAHWRDKFGDRRHDVDHRQNRRNDLVAQLGRRRWRRTSHRRFCHPIRRKRRDRRNDQSHGWRRFGGRSCWRQRHYRR